MSSSLPTMWDNVDAFLTGNKFPICAFHNAGGGLVPPGAVEVASDPSQLWRGSVRKADHFREWAGVRSICGKAHWLGLGVSMLLRAEDGLICMDLDGYNHGADDLPVDPVAKQAHEDKVNQIVSYALSLGLPVERSRSGTGYHVFFRGVWPNRMDNLPYGLGELFCDRQYINLTGHFLPTNELPPANGSALFRAWVHDALFGGHVPVKEEILASIDLGDTEIGGRRLDLSDEQVMFALESGAHYGSETAPQAMREIYDMLYFGTAQPDHSNAMFKLASALDKITGSADQVMSILGKSALYRLNRTDAKGEDRMHKFERNARKAFARIRESNNAILSDERKGSTWHAMQIHHLTTVAMTNFDNILIENPEQAEVREELQEMAAHLDLDEGTNADNLTPLTIKALGIIAPELSDNVTRNHTPPGNLGRLADLIGIRMYRTVPEFATTVAFATVAAYAAQRYKYHYDGPTVGFINGGRSAQGKSEAAKAAMKIVNDILDEESSNPEFKNVTNRIIRLKPESKQGMQPIFEQTSSLTWLDDEFETTIAKISAPSNTAHVTVRDLVLTAFDLSRDDQSYMPSQSRASSNAGEREIRNLCLSFAWSGTLEVMEQYITASFMTSGIGSRMLFTVYGGKPEQAKSNEIRYAPFDPNEPALRALKYVMLRGQEISDLYNELPASYTEAIRGKKREDRQSIKVPPQLSQRAMLIHVCAGSEVESYLRERAYRIDNFNDDFPNLGFPSYYTVFSRTMMHVQRLAALMAIMDRPDNPVMTLEHVQWAYQYVVLSYARIATGFDREEYGESLGGYERAYMAVVADLVKAKDKAAKEEAGRNGDPFVSVIETGLRWTDVKSAVGKHQIYKKFGENWVAFYNRAEQALAGDSVISIEDKQFSGRGRRGKVVKVLPHEAWQEFLGWKGH